MNPKPFASLNHFTVPVAIWNTPPSALKRTGRGGAEARIRYSLVDRAKVPRLRPNGAATVLPGPSARRPEIQLLVPPVRRRFEALAARTLLRRDNAHSVRVTRRGIHPHDAGGERAVRPRARGRAPQRRDRRARRPREDDARRRDALAVGLVPREPGCRRARARLDGPRA